MTGNDAKDLAEALRKRDAAQQRFSSLALKPILPDQRQAYAALIEVAEEYAFAEMELADLIDALRPSRRLFESTSPS